MDRRLAVFGTVVLVVVVAGAVVLSGQPSGGGYVTAVEVSEAPPDAAVVALSNDSIQDVRPFREAVRRAVRQGDEVAVSVGRDEMRNAFDVFTRLGDGDSLYVRHGGSVVVLQYAVP